MACPDLEAEAKYVADLQAMTLVEAFAEGLRLTTTDGREMVFRAN